MEGIRGSRGDEESHDIRELRVMADTVREALIDASGMSHDLELVRLVGTRRIAGTLERLEPSAEQSVWNMQPAMQFDPEDPGPGLTEASRARGIDTELVTRPTTLLTNPLLPSMYPAARVGPVFLRALVVDEVRLLVEGRDTADGEPTAWLTDRMDFVVPVVEIWRRTLALSIPVLGPGEEPALSKRQLRVARLLALGEKDQAIARRLDLSARTVEREVRTILGQLGVRSRTEAVLTMSGRGAGPGHPPRRTD